MKHIKKIVTSILTAALFSAMSVGTTFALFTSKAQTSVNIGSGIVSVSSSIGDLELYSASSTYTTGDVAGVISDGPFAGTYYYEPQVNAFANGGTASKEGSILSVERMTPGDKVKTNLAFVNNSNVNILYRITLETSTNSDAELLANMELKFLGRTYTGLKNMRTAWKPLAPNGTIDGTGLEVTLPLLAGNENQGKEISYAFSIEAVQGNAVVSGDDYAEYVTLATSTTTELEEDDVTQDSKLVNETVLETKVSAAAADEETVKVTVPANAQLEEGVNSLTLFVENMGETEQEGIIIDLDQGSELYEVTLEGLDENNTQPILVEVKLGYEPIAIYHKHGNEDPTLVDFTYDSQTGVTRFYTNNFSDYTFVRETEVIEVFTLNKLKEVRNFVNAGHSLAGKTVKLMADIDLAGESWNPIGNSKNNPFSGTFDGNGHTINHLSNAGLTTAAEFDAYDVAQTDSEDNSYGFIGYTDGTVTIKNVTFANALIKRPGARNTAVVVGKGEKGDYSSHLTIKDVTVGGKVYAKKKVAGIIGQGSGYSAHDASLQLINLVNNCDVTTTSERAGGILGGGGDFSTTTFTNCVNNGNIFVGGFGAGLAGNLNKCDLIYSNCVNNGTITGNEGAYYYSLFRQTGEDELWRYDRASALATYNGNVGVISGHEIPWAELDTYDYLANVAYEIDINLALASDTLGYRYYKTGALSQVLSDKSLGQDAITLLKEASFTSRLVLYGDGKTFNLNAKLTVTGYGSDHGGSHFCNIQIGADHTGHFTLNYDTNLYEVEEVGSYSAAQIAAKDDSEIIVCVDYEKTLTVNGVDYVSTNGQYRVLKFTYIGQ